MIIGISGKLGSGKDLVGSFIQLLTTNDPMFPPNKVLEIFKQSGMLLGQECRSRFTIHKFADPLKECAAIMLGCTREQLEDRDFKESTLPEKWWYYQCGDKKYPLGHFKGVDKEIADARFLVKTTVRLFLQKLGTEGGRDGVHPNIWVNAALADYTKDSHWIMTDTRFPNELESIMHNGGLTIRVNRGVETGDHPSETALDNAWFHEVIDNYGSLEDLLVRVKEILTNHGII